MSDSVPFASSECIGTTVPSFDIEFDGFAQAGACGLNILALRGHIELGASGDVPRVPFANECKEAVSHRAMLTKVL